MPTDLATLIGAGAATAVVLALVIYAIARTKIARGDRTFMTETEHGYKRALRGTTVLWNPDEGVLKGAHAPAIGFVARDPATGEWVEKRLLDANTGAVNLRVQTCAPRPFKAATKDDHHFLVQARVNFQLDRDRLAHVYHVQDFSSALEARILSAFRDEIGKCNDEEVRARGSSINAGVSRALNAMEREDTDTDQGGAAVGVPLGVKIYDASFDYTEITPEESGAIAAGAPAGPPAAAPDGSRPQPVAAPAAFPGVDASAIAPGAMSYRRQHLDVIADSFQDRDPASMEALLIMLEMQTRQNIAEALGRSGALVVLTPEELGLAGGATVREKVADMLESAREARTHAREDTAANGAETEEA